MIITDLAKAKACLQRIGYYRLSAYWYPFRQSEDYNSEVIVKDEFKAGTSFETIFELYIFDKKLRMIILDALERIEIALRTDIALLLGQYDPKAHRNPDLLHGNFAKRKQKGKNTTLHEEWLARLDDKFKKSREDFVGHFKNKYSSDHLPIWIATELFDFGALSFFYEGLKIQDKDKIAANYGVPSSAMLETWLLCLNNIRNICAHHYRLWNRSLVNQPSLPKTGAITEFDHVITNTRLYAALLIIKFLLKTINPSTKWWQRLVEHAGTLPVDQYIGLKNAGFPENWRDFHESIISA